MHPIGNILLLAKPDALVEQVRRTGAAANKNKLCDGFPSEEFGQRPANRELVFAAVRVKVGNHSQERSIRRQSQFLSKSSVC